jgi:hypothetical protein
MNKLLSACVALAAALSFPADTAALVEAKSDLNQGSQWGKTKAVKELPKEITVGYFNVFYMTTRVASGKHGNASLARRAEFNLSEETARATTDAGYAYLKAQLEAKGYTVKSEDAEVLKNTKTFQKYAAKDTAAKVVTGGGSQHLRDKDRVDERIVAYASQLTGVTLGPKGGAGYVPLSLELGGKEGRMTLNFLGIIDFTESEVKGYTAGNMDIVEVNFSPSLRMIDVPSFGGQSTLNYQSAKEIGGKVFGGHELKYAGVSWLKSHTTDQDQVDQFVVDEAGYQAAALDLLKAYIDQFAARIEDFKAAGK